MLEPILPILLSFVSLGAFVLGGKVRDIIHVVMPYKDPITLLLMTLVFSPVVLWFAGIKFLNPTNLWYIAFAVAFILCYSLAYIKGELNVVYVNVHTIISEKFPNGAEEIKPVVYFWDKNGNQCLQEQSFKEIMKAVLFGIHSPLRLDTGMIRRTRPVFMQKLLYPKLSVEAIDVVEEKIAETTVKKGLFKFKVRSYSYIPAPSCIDTTQNWLVSAYNQENLVKELTRKEAQLLETKTSAMSSFYAKSADLLVEMINDRTPGAEVYQDVIDRLAPDPRMVKIHTEEKKAELPEEPKKKKRGFLRRKPKEQGQEQEVTE